MSAAFRTISFSFEAIRGEYLSHMQWLRKGQPSCPFCTRQKLARGTVTELHWPCLPSEVQLCRELSFGLCQVVLYSECILYNLLTVTI